MIDHSLLRPELTVADIEVGLKLVRDRHTVSACVRPADVSTAAHELRDSDALVCTVIGFPHGSSTTSAKVFEAAEAFTAGADEIDMVINIGRLRSGDTAYVQDEIARVVEAADDHPVKVIFENAYLTDSEKVAGYRAAEDAGAAFIKTSTGFAPRGATADDVALMRRTVGPGVQVKAAGGVRTLDALLQLRSLGATRFRRHGHRGDLG